MFNWLVKAICIKYESKIVNKKISLRNTETDIGTQKQDTKKEGSKGISYSFMGSNGMP